MSPKKPPISDEALDSMLRTAASDVRQAHDALLSSSLQTHKQQAVSRALNQTKPAEAPARFRRSIAFGWAPAAAAALLLAVIWGPGKQQVMQGQQTAQPSQLAFMFDSYESDDEQGEAIPSFGEFSELLSEASSEYGSLAVEDESTYFEIPSMSLGVDFTDIEYMEDLSDEEDYAA